MHNAKVDAMSATRILIYEAFDMTAVAANGTGARGLLSKGALSNGYKHIFGSWVGFGFKQSERCLTK